MKWIFQAKDRYFATLPALRDLDAISWAVTRYFGEYAEGDEVALWKSGKDAGIYAFGHIAAFRVAGRSRPNPPRYWKRLALRDFRHVGKQHAIVKITRRLLEKPILRKAMILNSKLAELSILRAPIGTNFKVTDKEWTEIIRLAALAGKERASANARRAPEKGPSVAAS